jgi:DNA-binding SARP family transcriptional activator
VRLLGSFSVHPTGKRTPLRFTTRKAVALFAYLATHLHRPQQRDWLIQLLWGNVPASQGRHSLRQTLLTMRSALGAHASQLVTEGDDVMLRGTLRVDTVLLDRLAARGTTESVRLACALYKEDLLAGFVLGEGTYDAWLESERTRLRHVAIATLERRIDFTEAEAIGDALQTARRLVAISPLSEHGHRALIRLYARAGQPNAAFQQYEEYGRLLGETLGIPPDEETQELVRTLYARRLPPVP